MMNDSCFMGVYKVYMGVYKTYIGVYKVYMVYIRCR